MMTDKQNQYAVGPRARAPMTLLDPDPAAGGVASREARQITQLLLDPARVRVWAGNARVHANLTEAGCRDLIDSIVAEGGQKMPAIVRRVEGDPRHDYEVIAGTRRHWAVSWLRAHRDSDMMFVAQVHALDDEAAFRLADVENRARADVSDLERARNYAAALAAHYGGHQTRMAERLNVSKGWLSKMIKVAGIPDEVVAAFGSPDELQLKPAYALARALDDPARAKSVELVAQRVASEQAHRRTHDLPLHPPADVLRRLLSAHLVAEDRPPFYTSASRYGRAMVTVTSSGQRGLTVKLHARSGASEAEMIESVQRMIAHHRDHHGVSLS